jgi:AbrB family looped-hinge helix DNA binding protein
MNSVKISSKGMISIPAKLRHRYNLKPGDEVEFIETDEGLVLVPVVPLEKLINPANKERIYKIVRELKIEQQEEILKE